jgi:hypothetical protein
VKVPKIGLSDHYPTCVVFKENFGSKYRHTSIKYRSFKNFDQDKFFNDLNRCPWDSIEETNDIEHKLEIWYNLLTGVVDKHLPTKTKRVKRTKQPEWMTHDILECMRDRDHCKSVKDYVAYKILRNKCVSLIRQAKTIFYQSCIKNSKGDSSKLWKHIKDLAPNSLKTAPATLKDGDATITSTPDLCEMFNNYFSTVVNQYLPESNQAPDFRKLNDFVKSKISEDTVLSIPLLTCDEVRKSLSELDPHRATGLDSLSSKMLKLSASIIASPLTVIFNQSISYGHFPMQWKIARITPVHKSGSRTDKSNYRPISILCIVSKLLERHYHNCLLNIV